MVAVAVRDRGDQSVEPKPRHEAWPGSSSSVAPLSNPAIKARRLLLAMLVTASEAAT